MHLLVYSRHSPSGLRRSAKKLIMDWLLRVNVLIETRTEILCAAVLLQPPYARFCTPGTGRAEQPVALTYEQLFQIQEQVLQNSKTRFFSHICIFL